MALMTAEQFISYAEETLFGEGSECLFESIAEISNEIAMFGDSGPGSLYRLRQRVQEYNSIGARWSKLTGKHFRPVALPHPR